ncbi:hypothetical protein HU200_022798 [Digitaria exilis]|uniref:[RNA-polymerase]-subunit kinase n=1 Tax=Digitaria exilis TaxID=1010633 RepID=A0A835EYG6_9POAL|nr:hypothetical protein HU200_022798 [Digitaria exilis]
MHERRIIHRDIKPSNILVGPNCSVLKICDFGLAMSMDDEPPPYEPAGTLCYMAPEMLLDKPNYDERVDVWSLGCVMAELVNGWNPFQGLNEEGQLCAIFDVLGAPDDTAWPWFSSTAFATVVMPELDMQRSNLLREQFPETKLSKQGFEKRLTAAAALGLPWFRNKTDVLELPKTEEIALPLPKRLRSRSIPPLSPPSVILLPFFSPVKGASDSTAGSDGGVVAEPRRGGEDALPLLPPFPYNRWSKAPRPDAPLGPEADHGGGHDCSRGRSSTIGKRGTGVQQGPQVASAAMRAGPSASGSGLEAHVESSLLAKSWVSSSGAIKADELELPQAHRRPIF